MTNLDSIFKSRDITLSTKQSEMQYLDAISIKDRNGMELTEAEDIKKRWQEYTEEL